MFKIGGIPDENCLAKFRLDRAENDLPEVYYFGDVDEQVTYEVSANAGWVAHLGPRA